MYKTTEKTLIPDQVVRRMVECLLQHDFESLVQNKKFRFFFLKEITTVKNEFKHMWT